MSSFRPLAAALAAALAALTTLLPSHAAAQARFEAQIGWKEGASPSEVEFDTGSIQTRPFEKKTDHFFGRRTYQAIGARQDFVIRWPGLAVTLRARAQVPGPDSEAFFFRVARPNAGMLCNDADVAPLFRVARQSDVDTRIEAMQQVLVLLNRQDTGCSDFNRKNLARLLFVLNCNLAKQTDFFDLSPDVTAIYRSTFDGSPTVVRQVAECQDEINGLVAKAAKEEADRAFGQRNFDRFFELNTDLRVLSRDPEFEGGLEKQGILEVDLQHRQIEALNRQFEAALNDPDRSVDTAEKGFEAAQALEQLSHDPTYSVAFRQADLRLSSARAFPSIAEQVLVNARETSLDPLSSGAAIER